MVLRRSLLTLALLAPMAGCGTAPVETTRPPVEARPLAVTFAHLDHLSEATQTPDGRPARIVHIYADAPSYAWTDDSDEGTACVDDVARAAVVFLRDFERNGTAASRTKAEALLRFVAHLQTPQGTFYNFVWDRTLRINTEHANSKADRLEWWGARAVWALGEGARVLKTANPTASQEYAERVRRTYPHLRAALARYGETTPANGLTLPRWALRETAFDATSELVLGLAALQKAYPDPELASFVARFAEAFERARFGTLTAFPYGGHAAWSGGWHAWGNSQSMALVAAGRPASARAEADALYARLLVDGWQHELSYETRQWRTYEQIAYDVRTVAVGLAWLAEATGEARYATMAGLAASWFTGNNDAGRAMYDEATGRGYDGINGPSTVNVNSGAESTIEALMTVQEVNALPEARAWARARAEGPAVEKTVSGAPLRYRVFRASNEAGARRGALVLDLAAGTTSWREGDALAALLAAP